MEKVLVKEKLGGDGGQVALVVENGDLQLMVSYPVIKVLEPIKTKVVDKLKALIPGDKYDFVVDSGWEALLDVFGMGKKDAEPKEEVPPTV